MSSWAEQTADRLLISQALSSRSLSTDSLSTDSLSSHSLDGKLLEGQSLDKTSTIGSDGEQAPDKTRQQLVVALEQLAQQLSYDMAYGLSHELNNPLANIAARARLLAEQESSEAKRVVLSGIVDQAMRGCEMIADLMLLARPPELEIQGWSLAKIVEDVCRQARPWIDARQLKMIAPQVDSEASDWTIACDRQALIEALWCVLRNALEAARDCIELTLEPCSRAQIHNALCSGESKADEDAPGLLLIVRDDGPGLSEEALERAFYPYYSGREAGRGLGLGLCKARRYIEQFGGQIVLKNDPGGCVRIWLPSQRGV